MKLCAKIRHKQHKVLSIYLSYASSEELQMHFAEGKTCTVSLQTPLLSHSRGDRQFEFSSLPLEPLGKSVTLPSGVRGDILTDL